MKHIIEQKKQALEKRRNQRELPLITTYYLNEYLAHLDKTPVLREAYAVCALYQHMGLSLFPEEEIIGRVWYREPVFFHYGGGTVIDMICAEKYIDQQKMDDDEKKEFYEQIKRVEERHYWGGNPAVFNQAEQKSIAAHAATSTWFGGHMVLDYDTILQNGLDYYQDKIIAEQGKRKDKYEFYQAMMLLLHGIQDLIIRYANLAEVVSQKPEYSTAKCLQLSENLRHIAHQKPSSFPQALQLVWLLHMLNGSDSFGRFDRYLLDFYQADIRNGVLTKQQAFDWIVDFFIKIEEVNEIQNMTIGGTDEHGMVAYTELTIMCMEAARLLKFKGPNLCLRVTADMPEKVWDTALDCLSTGIGIPALYNDSHYIQSLVAKGVLLQDANQYCLAGCSQIMVPGMCNFYNDVGMVNIAKILEISIYGGYDPNTEQQVGLQLKGLSECTSFSEFYNIFYNHLDYFCKLENSINNKDAVYRGQCEGYAMRTLFMRGCLENGKTIFEGGARYNNIELEVIGITNVCDSLYAVKKAVFEDAILSPIQMIKALKCNFKGYDKEHNYLKKLDKFGNDKDEVDRLRAEISERVYRNFNQSHAALGGIIVPGEVIFVAHEYAGMVTGATPDGRLQGTVLADSAGAVQGKDINGPTALLNSILKIPVRDFLLTSVVVNLKFIQSLFMESIQKIKILFQTFFDQGGMQLQINVVNQEDLQRAMKYPDEYRSLVVRVGGYSDYFVNLSPTLQQEIIKRTLQNI